MDAKQKEPHTLITCKVCSVQPQSTVQIQARTNPYRLKLKPETHQGNRGVYFNHHQMLTTHTCSGCSHGAMYLSWMDLESINTQENEQ